MNEIDKVEEVKTVIEIWDNSKRAKNLITVFYILMGLTVVGIISGYFELEILYAVQSGEVVSMDEADANDLRQGIIGMIQFAIYITSAIVFLNWFRRAYGNLHRLKMNLDHSNYDDMGFCDTLYFSFSSISDNERNMENNTN